MEGQQIEGQESMDILIVWGTLFMITIAVVFVIFIINIKRKLYLKEALVDLLQNKCMQKIEKVEDKFEKEIKGLQQENETLKKEMKSLKERLN